jgi:hypothetical protein
VRATTRHGGSRNLPTETAVSAVAEVRVNEQEPIHTGGGPLCPTRAGDWFDILLYL